MKRQNVSLSNGGLDHRSDTAGFDTIAFRNVSQDRWMATSVPQATADRRTTTDAVRCEGERLRSVRANARGRRRPCPAMLRALLCKSSRAERLWFCHPPAKSAIAGQTVKSTAMAVRVAEEI